MKKRLFTGLCGMVLCCALSFQVMAASMTATQAKALAEKHVPSGSIFVRTEDDDGKFEVKYYSSDKTEQYEVDVSKSSEKMLSFSSELYKDRGYLTITLTEKDAKKVVSDEIKDAQISSAKLEQEDGVKEYVVKFKTKDFYGEYDINPETGTILSRDIFIGAKPSAAETTGLMTYERAKELAMKQVPDGIITEVNFEREDGTFIYEVEVYKDGFKHDLVFDANTEKLLWNSKNADDGWFYYDQGKPVVSQSSASADNYIGLQKAKDIALSKAPTGAVIRKCNLDYDDGIAVYEGELRNGTWECDFEIDAVTGNILEWDAEYDG